MLTKLIILSDLWGIEQADWLNLYINELALHFDVHFIDCCDLGGVDKSHYLQKNLHNQFVAGGIDKAVESLLNLKLDRVTILAFSVGGVIAWKYGLVCDNIESLYCVSSTRLRYESSKPSCQLNLYFGDKDEFTPSKEWFDGFDLENNLIKGKGHYLYRDETFIKSLSTKIVEDKPLS